MRAKHARTLQGTAADRYPVWLFVLTWAGRDWLLATEAVEVTDAIGTVRPFAGTLSPPRFAEGLEPLTAALSRQPVALSFYLPEDVSVAQLEARGHRLDAARGELSRWIPGRAWEAREVVLTGEIAAPEIPQDGDPAEVSLRGPDTTAVRLLIPPGALVDAISWPTSLENQRGVWYPWVFGSPGWIDDGSGERARATPGVPATPTVSANRLVINAEHSRGGTVEADRYDNEAGPKNYSIVNGSDSAGRDVTYLEDMDIGGIPTGPGEYSEAGDHWISWGGAAGSATAQGVMDRKRTGFSLQYAGELVERMLQESGVEFDRGATAALRDRLVGSGWAFGGYIAEPISPIEWLQKVLLPLIPVSLYIGPRGVTPVLWEMDLPKSAATTHIDVDRGDAQLEGGLLVEDTPVYSIFRLSWALDGADNTYKRESYLTGDSADAGAAMSYHARLAYQRHGPRELAVQSAIIWSLATARRTLSYWARRYSYRPRTVALSAGPELEHLRRGQAVRLSADALHLDDRLGLVVDRQTTISGVDLVIWMQEDLARDPRLASP